MSFIKRFISEEYGATAVEYAVMLALIAVACIIAIHNMGDGTGNIWEGSSSDIGTHFDDAGVNK